MAEWVDALEGELVRWVGTPYKAGESAAGVAADCVGFGAGVYDELYARAGMRPAGPVPRHAWDVAFHNRREAARTSALIRRRWPGVETVWRKGESRRRPLTFQILQPGDALLVAVARNSPGHMMIVGARPYTLFHADVDAGVCYTGAGAYLRKIIRVWRSTVREQWGQ